MLEEKEDDVVPSLSSMPSALWCSIVVEVVVIIASLLFLLILEPTVSFFKSVKEREDFSTNRE